MRFVLCTTAILESVTFITMSLDKKYSQICLKEPGLNLGILVRSRGAYAENLMNTMYYVFLCYSELCYSDAIMTS